MLETGSSQLEVITLNIKFQTGTLYHSVSEYVSQLAAVYPLSETAISL
jgi:hypothetical protein